VVATGQPAGEGEELVHQLLSRRGVAPVGALEELGKLGGVRT
jgi:hypothetical protein